MTITKEAPVREGPAQTAEPPLMSPTRETRLWPRILAVAVVLVALAAGVVAGLAINNSAIDDLRSDVESLQVDLQATREQLTDVRLDLLAQTSGYSLDREHLAQAYDTGLSLGMIKEHLAQATP